MEKGRIPQGYMTVGEIAKKMSVTVRTLQYYDKEGVLSPSAESEGGRRLYTHKDIVKLHQVQSMKYLGFSLKEIKTRLPVLETPEEVADLLSEQTKEIKRKIDSLADVLESIKKLNVEVLQTQAVDWEKYANILILLQLKSEMYWAITHFDSKMLDHLNHLDSQSAYDIVKKQKQLFKKLRHLQRKGASPKCEESQAFAKDFWDITAQMVGDDLSLLPKFAQIAEKHGDSEWRSMQPFIEEALSFYFTSLGYDPFLKASKEETEEK